MKGDFARAPHSRLDTRITRVALVVALVAVLFAATALSACNAADEQPVFTHDTVTVSVTDVGTGEEGYTVYMTFTATEKEPLATFTASVVTEDGRKNAFYLYQTLTVSIPNAEAERVARQVTEALSDGTGAPSDDGLKIVYYYDTINKKITSNGVRTETEAGYRHSVVADTSSEITTFTLSSESPYSANWYGLLVGCAVAVLIIVAVVTGVAVAAKKGRLWQKGTK